MMSAPTPMGSPGRDPAQLQLARDMVLPALCQAFAAALARFDDAEPAAVPAEAHVLHAGQIAQCILKFHGGADTSRLLRCNIAVGIAACTMLI